MYQRKAEGIQQKAAPFQGLHGGRDFFFQLVRGCKETQQGALQKAAQAQCSGRHTGRIGKHIDAQSHRKPQKDGQAARGLIRKEEQYVHVWQRRGIAQYMNMVEHPHLQQQKEGEPAQTRKKRMYHISGFGA